jgi:hypothetical protein
VEDINPFAFQEGERPTDCKNPSSDVEISWYIGNTEHLA